MWVLYFYTGVTVGAEELIANYGYIAVLIGTFFEGETILLIAGFFAHLGYLKLSYVIAAAFAGSLAGDQLFFYAGRIKGIELVNKRPVLRSKAERIFKLMHRHQTVLILGFRFLYGFRTITPVVLGASGISPVRFLILNICGALLWAVIIGVSGYYFGKALELLIGNIKQYEFWVITALLLTSFAVWIVDRWRENNRDRSHR